MRWIFLTAVLLLLVGCGNQEAVEEPAVKPGWTSLLVKDGRVTGVFSGVDIEIDPAIKANMVMKSGKNVTITDNREKIELQDDTYISVNGARLEIKFGEFYVGKSNYGPIGAGDKVHISTEGVKINGQPAGPLPAGTLGQ